jgi:hypothetical protein
LPQHVSAVDYRHKRLQCRCVHRCTYLAHAVTLTVTGADVSSVAYAQM